MSLHEITSYHWHTDSGTITRSSTQGNINAFIPVEIAYRYIYIYAACVYFVYRYIYHISRSCFQDIYQVCLVCVDLAY